MSKDKESICVTVRVRPLSSKQLEEDSRICLRVDEQANMISMNGPNAERDAKDFYFDSVCDSMGQNQMFEKVGKRSTVFCMEGYNCTIFAYGQTGAGKTYTMMGVNPESKDYFEQRGLIPRTLEHLFECIEKEITEAGVDYIIKCSFIEIYNQQIIDLLGTGSSALNIREDLKKGVYIEGVTEEIISQSEQAMQILRKGSKGRHVGSTFYNETSSRSHSVFTMQIQSQQISNGIKSTKSRHFHFIDLAGSERTKKSMGDRLKEGCSINKSLHVLSMVISSLAEVSEGKSRHVNYRDSKLTFLLKDSLGGNSKTHLIANISPSLISSLETKSTLMFARKVKLIKVNKVSINEDASGNLQSLKAEIRRLRSENLLLMNGGSSMNSQQALTSNQAPGSNSKMVTVLQKYVDEELEKQTQLQLEITKLTNRNNNLQKGIQHFSNNEKQLRMVIAIYEDKISKLKRAESLLMEKVDQLSATQEMDEIKTYFEQERKYLIQQVEKYKAISSSAVLIKNLLRELKTEKQPEGSSKQETVIEALTKNNQFLQTIKNSIRQMQPQIQEGKASKALTQENEELRASNVQLRDNNQKIALELAETKDRMEESETLLGEAIAAQISLEKKIQEQESTHKEEINRYQAEISGLRANNEKLQQQLKSQSLKESEKQMLISQYELQITELRNQLTSMSDKKQNDLKISEQRENQLKGEIEKIQDSLRKKVDELQLLKAQNSSVKMQQQKNRLEMTNLLNEASSRIEELEQMKTRAEAESSDSKQKWQGERQAYENSLIKKDMEIMDVKQKINELTVQIKGVGAELASVLKQKQSLLQKIERSEALHNQERKKWEENHSQLIGMINNKKVSDSETQSKLTEAQLELINMNEKNAQLTIKLKTANQSLVSLQALLESRQAQTTDIIQQKENQIVSLSAQILEHKAKLQSLNQSDIVAKRSIKLMEEELASKEDTIARLGQQLEKSKKKQKEARIGLNDSKGELYALKKSTEIEIEALKEQLVAKEDSLNQALRQAKSIKDNSEKTIAQMLAKMQSEYEILRQNQASIKKAMQVHLANKQKRITELKTSNDSLQLLCREQRHKIEELNEVIAALRSSIQVQRDARVNLEQINSQKEQILAQSQLRLSEVESQHMRAIEQMQNNFMEETDQKNATIQQLTNKLEVLSVQIEDLKTQHNVRSEEVNLAQQVITQIRIQKSAIIVENQSLKDQIVWVEQQLQLSRAQTEQLCRQKQQKTLQNLSVSEQLNMLVQDKQQAIANLNVRTVSLEQELSSERAQKQATLNQLASLRSQSELEVVSLKQANSELAENLRLVSAQKIQLENSKMEAEKQAIQTKQTIQQTSTANLQLQNKINFYMSQMSEVKAKSEQNASLSQEYTRKIFQENSQLKQQLAGLSRQNQELLQKLNGQIDVICQLESKNNQMNVWLQHKHNEVLNLQRSIEQLARKHEAQSNQHLETLKTVHEQSSRQSQRLNELYEEARQQLEVEKSKYLQLSMDKNSYIIEFQNKITQLQNEVNKQASQISWYSTELLSWKQKHAAASKSAEEQNNKLQALDLERDRGNKAVEQVKKEAERKLADSEKRCHAAASQLNSLREEIKLIQNEAGVWKQRMQNLENQIRLSNERADKFRSEYLKEKESNKEFKMLLDNAHCQIQSFKAEVMDKDRLYHQLLEKVSKNDIERKGLMSQDKKFSDLLEKSRIEVNELRKKYDDQLKINNILKQQMEKKDLDSEVVKQKSEEYCRKQQQLMESIRNDYTKLQIQLRNTKQSSDEMKKALKKVTLKNQQLQQKVQQLNKECITAQMQNDELKKDSLRTGIDERQVSYVNRLKQENTQLKREIEKLTQEIITLGHEKIKQKAEHRQSKEPEMYTLELNKKNCEIKYLQKIIDDSVTMLGIKEYKKTIGDSLKIGIENLQRELASARKQLAMLTEDLSLKSQKIQILEGQRPKIAKDQDDTLMKMRNKINRTSSNFESIRQSKQQDKLILQMKDPNKLSLWGLSKP